ncbi:hypothetical protein ABPG74_007634 [Tetrahymena malaccensis]
MRKSENLSEIESPNNNQQNINTEIVHLNQFPAIACENSEQIETKSYESKIQGSIEQSTTNSEAYNKKQNLKMDFSQQKEEYCFTKVEQFKECSTVHTPTQLLHQNQDSQIDQLNIINPLQLVQEIIKKQLQKKYDEEIKSELLLQGAHLSRLSICRLFQLISVIGYQIYYIFWQLYTQSQLNSYYIIKKFDSSNGIDILLVSITILLTTISFLLLSVSLSIVLELRKSNSIKNIKIKALKVQMIFIDLLAFVCFLIYNQDFLSSDFIIAGFINFAQYSLIQFYYLKQYQEFVGKQKLLIFKKNDNN